MTTHTHTHMKNDVFDMEVGCHSSSWRADWFCEEEEEQQEVKGSVL